MCASASASASVSPMPIVTVTVWQRLRKRRDYYSVVRDATVQFRTGAENPNWPNWTDSSVQFQFSSGLVAPGSVRSSQYLTYLRTGFEPVRTGSNPNFLYIFLFIFNCCGRARTERLELNRRFSNSAWPKNQQKPFNLFCFASPP
jgi:hypothetical protein